MVNGKVIVIGGGIGGIQCALDLADTGYYVYLLEKSATLGGTMARLDKTFPTNDCSTCMFSPKLVQAAGHANIEILTDSQLLDLEGVPGHFSARIQTLRSQPVPDLQLCVPSQRGDQPGVRTHAVGLRPLCGPSGTSFG